MSRRKFRDILRFSRGYISSRSKIDDPNYSDNRTIPSDYAAEGSANVLFTGQSHPEPFKGVTVASGTGGTQSFQFSNGYSSLGKKSATAGKGSVFSYIGRSLWFIGAGEVLFNGNSLTGSPAASTTLQFRLYETSTYNGTTFTAGLSAPVAPTVAAGDAGTKLSGTYSVRLSAIRSTTGAESNASPSSAVVNISATKFRITFPAAVGNGHDKWGVYVTAGNYGMKGPHYQLPAQLTGESPIGFVKESTVAASALGGAGSRNLDFEWFDGDLVGQNLAPIENFVPPLGTHSFVLEGCMSVVGCYAGVDAVSVTNPGNMIAVSRAGFPEAFPVDADHLLALPEPPTAVLTRAAGGYVYIAGKNSLSLVRYTGAVSKAPLALSVLWSDTGFDNPNCACLADGQLFGYTSERGPVRIDDDGNPDYLFASGVSKQFVGVSPANVVVGYDRETNMVVYGYTQGGLSRLICFNKAYGIWSTPINFEDLVSVPAGGPAVIKGSFSNAGQLFLILDTGSTEYAIYEFNAGSGSTWKLQSAWRDGGTPEKNKTITALHMATDNDNTNPVSLTLYKNLSSTVADSATYSPVGTPEHLPVKRTNLRGVKTYAVKMSGTDDSTLGLEILVEGVYSEIDS